MSHLLVPRESDSCHSGALSQWDSGPMSFAEGLSQGARNCVQVVFATGPESHFCSNSQVSVTPSLDDSRFPRAPAMPGRG